MSNLEAHHNPHTKSFAHPMRNLVTSMCLIHGPGGLSLMHSSAPSLHNFGCKFCKDKHKNVVFFSWLFNSLLRKKHNFPLCKWTLLACRSISFISSPLKPSFHFHSFFQNYLCIEKITVFLETISDIDLCRNATNYRDNHKYRDAIEITLKLINVKY